mmetsp:Transcript_8717/g.18428  ORF Transcript_8717/g.18428 Transcript_8717/m.18428 type:complete len:177 (-) Transcript_8717:21-551(-)
MTVPPTTERGSDSPADEAPDPELDTQVNRGLNSALHDLDTALRRQPMPEAFPLERYLGGSEQQGPRNGAAFTNMRRGMLQPAEKAEPAKPPRVDRGSHSTDQLLAAALLFRPTPSQGSYPPRNSNARPPSAGRTNRTPRRGPSVTNTGYPRASSQTRARAVRRPDEPMPCRSARRP